MEEDKIPKQKPHTSFNRRLSVVKNPEGGTWQRPRKMFKILFYRGNMTKGGEYGKGYYGTLIIVNLTPYQASAWYDNKWTINDFGENILKKLMVF